MVTTIERPLRRYSNLDSGMLVRLFRNEDVFIPSGDDHTKPENIQRFIDYAIGSEHVFILGRDPKREAFIFAPNHNATTYQAHFAVRKDGRDGQVVAKAYEAGTWMEEHSDCRSVISFIRRDNAGARSVLAQLGMRRVGVLTKSVLFNGELVDEIVYQATIDEIHSVMRV
jgi:hypothetical protein